MVAISVSCTVHTSDLLAEPKLSVAARMLYRSPMVMSTSLSVNRINSRSDKSTEKSSLHETNDKVNTISVYKENIDFIIFMFGYSSRFINNRALVLNSG